MASPPAAARWSCCTRTSVFNLINLRGFCVGLLGPRMLLEVWFVVPTFRRSSRGLAGSLRLAGCEVGKLSSSANRMRVEYYATLILLQQEHY